jgi:RNA polymerase sigma-70 factor, ECF subfamily
MLEPTVHTRSTDTLATHARRPGAPGSEPEALPDLLLIERARAGDERAIEALIRRYSRRLYRVAASVLMDEERAESATLEACLAAFGDLSRYELTGKFAAWLTRLAYNQARALRTGASGVARAETTPADEQHAIEHAIGALPEAFRVVYVLRVVEGISGIETAASLGLHETTVRTRLYRAHRRLSPEMARRLQATPAVLEPSAAISDRIVARALARLVHGSMLTSSAAPP